MSPHDFANKPDNVQSPLHRLQHELAKDMPHGYSISQRPEYRQDADKLPSRESETASIYSFDSVSTSGRLLDRLDLDDDFSDVDSILRRRESTVSLQSTGRLLDRLGLDDSPEETSHNPFNSMHARPDAPIRVNSSLGLDRMRSANKVPSRAQSQSNRVLLNSAAHKVVQPTKNFSFDSLNGEISSGQNSSTSLQSLANHSSGSLAMDANQGVVRHGSQLNIKKYPASSPIQEGFDSRSPSNTSSPSAVQLSSTSSHASSSEHSAENPLPMKQPQTKRTVSASSNGSSSSFEASSYFFNPNARFDASIEAATSKAIQIRSQGNPRESSYRLKLLADNPVNYPRAMYQYAKALWHGQGVKLSVLSGARWLCRCIMTSYILESTNIDCSDLNHYIPNVADMTAAGLIHMVYKNISSESNDVFSLTSKFQALPASVISKVVLLNSNDKNTVGGSYFILGECLITGKGEVTKSEELSRAFLAKSASLGYSDAMNKLGELWCSKSKAFKKDLHIAAAWLRLGEMFGKKDMGNSWIYKEKYLTQKIK